MQNTRAWRRGTIGLGLVLACTCAAPGSPLAAPRSGAATEGRPLTGAFDPADLVRTLATAVRERDDVTYRECLADSFRFTPYPAVPVEHPDIAWSGWGRRREAGFVTEWLRQRGGGRLDLEDVLDRSAVGPDRAEWDIAYRLTALGQEFRSRGIFVMVRSAQRWYLSEWIDTTIATDPDGRPYPTSGDLRAVIVR